jgi:hypothetical protein
MRSLWSSREGAHAVTDQYQRQAGVLVVRAGDEQIDVMEELAPPVRAELAEIGLRGRAGAVAAVVLAVHDESGRGECRGEICVAQHVLAHAVGQLDDASGGVLGFPSERDDVQAVTCRVGEPVRGDGRGHEAPLVCRWCLCWAQCRTSDA